MFAYYLTFAAAVLLSILLIDAATSSWMNFMKLGRESNLNRILWNAVLVLLVTVSWTEFLYLANRQKSSPIPVAMAPHPIRPAIRHTEWYAPQEAPHTGRIIHAVFSPGDTILVRWMENREVIHGGEMSNYGAGWVTVAPSEEYPTSGIIAWQPL